MENKDNAIELKFKAIREKLDWQGNIVEDVDNYTYKWEEYDPQVFLESVIRKGDLSSVPSLGGKRDRITFMQTLDRDFARFEDYHTALGRYTSIESEPFNGIKFVVYDRANDTNMKWVME